MSIYIVSFMKEVIGNNGIAAEICQNSIEIDAPNRQAAGELAKRRFCEREQLPHWSLHADRIEVEEADFPS